MRALISTFGTRGDVEPYLALAERLRAEGHDPVLCAPEPYRADAEAAGVGFEPGATRMHELVREQMTTVIKPTDAVRTMRRMTDAMRESLDDQWRAAQRTEPEVVISHPKALAGPHIAERLGVPFVASLPLPFLTPTRAFPIPFLTADLPGPLNRATYQFNRFTAIAYGGMINRFRRTELGIRRASRLSDYLHRDGEQVPVLYPFSRHIVPRPADYPDSAHITGPWFRPEPPVAWTPPPALRAFLDDGEPPVYLGFGSMGFRTDAAARGLAVQQAARAAGVRLVVSRGWGGIDVSDDEHVHVIDDAPHAELFPLVAAVVHHGGSGTTAAGLRAGRPTLTCPVLGDQPFWGKRVHLLGAGPEPLPQKRITADGLSARLRELVDSAEHRRRAPEIAERMSQEDGTGEAVSVLERIVERSHLTRDQRPRNPHR
ncbi:glycosyltransferase [Microbacterium bovistercoris]|uniref:Glycosyltransferase n=1 Tax=Microbacterium bovistercoris TaxID=2293570 RepID=A0A371NSC6_9MICO|nr:glycosyltransferase [Microbacterium bovistercoris]REJ05111.1 glycosyltransferase [Microbacterium bovistercoris]